MSGTDVAKRGTRARLVTVGVVLAVVLGVVGALSPYGISRARGVGSDDRVSVAPQHMPWAVVLCRLSGDHPMHRTNTYFEHLFTEASNGMGGVYDFFLDASQGNFSIGGTKIFGPYTVPLTYAQEYAGAQAEASAGRDARAWRVQNCIDAANPQMDFSPFAGVVAIYNSGTESGFTARTMTLDGKTIAWPLVILDPGAWNVSFAAHEIAHGMGFGHSRSVKYPDKDYGDPYDIMSFETGNEGDHPYFAGAFMPKIQDPAYNYKTRYDWSASPQTWQWTYRFIGPSLSAPWRYGRGWLSETALRTVSPSGCHVYTLKEVNDRTGLVALRIPLSPGRAIFVEYRHRNRWDSGLERDTVVLHELRDGDARPWVIDAPDPQFLESDVYHDPHTNVSIRIQSIDPYGQTATVMVYERGPAEVPVATVAKAVTDLAGSVAAKVPAGASLAQVPSAAVATVLNTPSCPPDPSIAVESITELDVVPSIPPSRIIDGRVTLPPVRKR